MAKKAKLSLVYLIGMVVTVIGFICPMFDFKLAAANGFDFIDFGNSGFVSIGALLIFIGAVAGVVACFLPMLKSYKLLCLIVTIVGGIILVIGFTTNGGIYKAIGNALFKTATYGFYMVIVGWVISLIGYLMKK